MSSSVVITPPGISADDNAPPASIPAGPPEEIAEGCARLDPAAVLRATPRSFALRVRGCSMVGAGICDGDTVVGEFTPEARIGAIVVALIDGESTLKRFVMHEGRPCLVSENPNCPDFVPLSELVIQGVVHSVVRRIGR
jgi:repressor LexA